MAATQNLTISLVLWQVYYSNQEEIERRFAAWIDHAYATNTPIPNIVCVAHLAASRANRELLEFYLGAAGDEVLPELPAKAVQRVQPSAVAPEWLKDSRPLPPSR